MMDIYHAFCPKSVYLAPTRLNRFDHPWAVVMPSLTSVPSLNRMSGNGWSTRMIRQHSGSKR